MEERSQEEMQRHAPAMLVLFWTAVVRNKVGGGQIIAGARHLSVSRPASK